MILFYDLFLSINFCSWCCDWLAGWLATSLLGLFVVATQHIIYLKETTYFWLLFELIYEVFALLSCSYRIKVGNFRKKVTFFFVLCLIFHVLQCIAFVGLLVLGLFIVWGVWLTSVYLLFVSSWDFVSWIFFKILKTSITPTYLTKFHQIVNPKKTYFRKSSNPSIHI